MIRAVWAGRTVWQDEPHRVGLNEIETRAAKAAPAIPAGAALFCDCPEGGASGRLMGYVKTITPTKMERWLIGFVRTADVAAMNAESAVLESAAVEEVQEVPPPAAPFQEGTPIMRLRELIPSRTWEKVAELAPTVEELARMTDEALLAIDGLGPRSLHVLRDACAKVTDAAGE